jgi:hypothetical protein
MEGPPGDLELGARPVDLRQRLVPRDDPRDGPTDGGVIAKLPPIERAGGQHGSASAAMISTSERISSTPPRRRRRTGGRS